MAISTPPGRGGIGIVRLSGSRAKEITEPMLRLKRPLVAGRARFAEVIDLPGEFEGSASEMERRLPRPAPAAVVLDEAVATYFAEPYSYTGEDVVEIAAHGSPVLLNALLRRCVAAGARLAEPGEFTQRAFLSGRLDLTQAEAVHDLIQATTLEQARTAARQMGGGLSLQIKPLKAKLIDLIAALEAGIDFAEDDLEVLSEADLRAKLSGLSLPLRALEESFAYGRVLREGYKLAIAGRPNAGKSSLFNRLIGRQRAIVTAQPGTTRDPVTEQIEFAGIPVEVVDTAGLRSTTIRGTTLDEAEAIGVAKSRETLAEAEIMLLVIAADEGVQEEDRLVLKQAAGRNLIVVLNKVDLIAPETATAVFEGRAVVKTSAVAGTGLDELRGAILGTLKSAMPSGDSAPLTNLRQHQAVSAAAAALQAADAGVHAGIPHEMVLLDLHEALDALDGLTGQTHTDEILGVIFSKFCIGK